MVYHFDPAHCYWIENRSAVGRERVPTLFSCFRLQRSESQFFIEY